MDANNENRVNRRMALQRMSALLGSSAAWPVMAAAPIGLNNSPNFSHVENPDVLRIPAWYYQQFDADFSLEVPEESFGGWKKTDLDFARKHTAVVVMHAWEAGQRYEEYPGWWECVPYIPRSNAVMREVFPPLLEAVRASDLPLFHVVGGGDYFKNTKGYQRAVALAGPAPVDVERISSDPLRDRLQAFRNDNVHVGKDNAADVHRGFAKLDFAAPARPVGEEGVAENAHQLFALCKEREINHLIYCGFAINWCLLLSPGGMADMSKRGMMCSALRQATVAVENKETARKQLCKEIALWRIALAFGFVLDVEDFVQAIRA